MKRIAADSYQWYNRNQQKGNDKPCFDAEFTKSLINDVFFPWRFLLLLTTIRTWSGMAKIIIFIYYTGKKQDNPCKSK